jgi:hypothetical protein
MSTSPNAYGASANPIGTSTGATSPWGDSHSRSLTSGEIEMAKTIFKESIDYNVVKVHDKGFLIFDLQPAGSGMTPFGEIHTTKQNGDYCIVNLKSCAVQTDYSTANPGIQAFFIHEMVHVWQYQLGFSVAWRGFLTFLSGGYNSNSGHEKSTVYDYDANSVTQTKFSDFNYEQQGDIIADYYLATVYPATNKESVIKLPGLRLILIDFFNDPNDKKLLPK